MVHIGKIKSVHGVGGDIVLEHNLKANFKLETITCLLLELWNKSYIPFFVEEIEALNAHEALVKFEEIKDREQAKEILHKGAYSPSNINVEVKAENQWLALLGYTLWNEDKEVCGIIKDILLLPSQTLLEVYFNNKDVLIPISDELILDINPIKKILQLEIAQGLFDL